jgi:hypothetical protein
MNWLNESSTVLNLLTKGTLIVLVAILLSSCALLDKLRGVANPHSEILIEVPVVTEDIRG